jgi:hypothetical protein
MATKNNQWTKVISKMKKNEVKSKKNYSTPPPAPARVPNLKCPVTYKVVEYTWAEHQKLNNCKCTANLPYYCRVCGDRGSSCLKSEEKLIEHVEKFHPISISIPISETSSIVTSNSETNSFTSAL